MRSGLGYRATCEGGRCPPRVMVAGPRVYPRPRGEGWGGTGGRRGEAGSGDAFGGVGARPKPSGAEGQQRLGQVPQSGRARKGPTHKRTRAPTGRAHTSTQTHATQYMGLYVLCVYICLYVCM